MAQPDAIGSAALVPGWYGKMPGLGDFASRRLPPEFIAAWDAWLQRSIASSRRELGEAWLDAFLTSPMWRFALAPGVCGAAAWAGLVLPSVDKVGRYFPLTFAAALPPDTDVAALLAAQAWYAQLESVGLSALDPACTPDALESTLSGCSFTAGTAMRNAGFGPALTDCLRGASRVPCAFNFESADALAGAMAATADEIGSEAFTAKSLLWSVAHDTGVTEFHCSTGLPPDDYYAVLLRGPLETTPLDPLQAFDEMERR
jgi:type VI secretion system protein ImpM